MGSELDFSRPGFKPNCTTDSLGVLRHILGPNLWNLWVYKLVTLLSCSGFQSGFTSRLSSQAHDWLLWFLAHLIGCFPLRGLPGSFQFPLQFCVKVSSLRNRLGSLSSQYVSIPFLGREQPAPMEEARKSGFDVRPKVDAHLIILCQSIDF